MKNKFCPFLLIILLTLTSCVTVTGLHETPVLPQEKLCPEKIEWAEVQQGIFVTEYIINQINVKWTCIRVDLATSGISFTPATSTSIPAVSINTTPFDKNFIPIGIVKNEGIEYFPPNSKYAVLCINTEADCRAVIFPSQDDAQLQEYEWAFGGYFQILQDEQILEFAKYRHSRSACGISDNGRYLYLFAATGINSMNDENGLCYEECAVILKFLGCKDAMEFDGGHSTSLSLNGVKKIKPVFQRKVPASLSIYCD